MNTRSFRINFALVITAYALALAVLATLAYLKHQAYSPFKDAVPLVIAVPAAWLRFLPAMSLNAAVPANPDSPYLN